LCEIASVVGTPLIIASATQNRLFSHYMRIQVDMDLSRCLFYEILVERDGFAFNMEVQYERLPDFCFRCKNICHNISKCCWLHPQQNGHADNEKSMKLDKRKHQEKI